MNNDENPKFPALLVEADASVGVLENLDDWTDDVDQWFWSSPETFLIDQRGWRFEQSCERSADGRPLAPPVWVFGDKLDQDFIRALLEDRVVDDPIVGDCLNGVDFEVGRLIEAVATIDS